MAGRRRTIWMGDNLWALIVRAAAQATIDTGKRISASEWLRRSAEEKLSDSK